MENQKINFSLRTDLAYDSVKSYESSVINGLIETKEVIKEVKEYAKRLSNFKRPTTILVSREALPRTATKKVKRKEIKQEYDKK